MEENKFFYALVGFAQFVAVHTYNTFVKTLIEQFQKQYNCYLFQ